MKADNKISYSYQGIPSIEENLSGYDNIKQDASLVHNEKDSYESWGLLLQKFRLRIAAIATLVSVTIIFTVMFSSLFSSTYSRVVCAPSDEIVRSVSATLPVLGASDAGFCKTSCDNPCASFPSVYGSLCCEWTSSAEGDKSCQQRITADGVCLCEAEGETIPKRPSDSVPVSVPVQKPAGIPKEHKKSDDDWNNDNWKPFGSGWEPMPGWTPFKPIKVPDGASECKKSCDHPCGWSQSGGHRVCCEKETDRDCSVTQINGKCYCG